MAPYRAVFAGLLLTAIVTMIILNNSSGFRTGFSSLYKDSDGVPPSTPRNDSSGAMLSVDFAAEVLAQYLRDGQLCPSSAYYRGDPGRMGNNFWELLSAWVVAFTNRKPLMLPKEAVKWFQRYFDHFDFLLYDPKQPAEVYADENRFSCPAMGDKKKWVVHHQKYYTDRQRISSDNQIADKTPFFKIIGYPAPTEYVMDFLFTNRDIVLSQFPWRADVLDGVKSRMRKYVAHRNYSTLVGLHSRQTDYPAHLKKYNKQSHAAGANYFVDCQNYFRKKFVNPLFLIVSDDMDWCRKNLDAPDVVFAGNGEQLNPGLDLILLSQCDHMIMSYGTFGATAAYMIKGEVLHGINFTIEKALDEFQTVLLKYRPKNWKFVSVVEPNALELIN